MGSSGHSVPVSVRIVRLDIGGLDRDGDGVRPGKRNTKIRSLRFQSSSSTRRGSGDVLKVPPTYCKVGEVISPRPYTEGPTTVWDRSDHPLLHDSGDTSGDDG